MNLVLAVSLVILRQTCLVKQGSKCFGAEPSLSSSFNRRNDHACHLSFQGHVHCECVTKMSISLGEHGTDPEVPALLHSFLVYHLSGISGFVLLPCPPAFGLLRQLVI